MYFPVEMECRIKLGFPSHEYIRALMSTYASFLQKTLYIMMSAQFQGQRAAL